MTILRNIRFFILFSVFCSCTSNVSESNNFDLKGEETERFEVFFNEVKEALLKDNSKLWNHKLYGPLLFVNPETREVFASEKDKEGILTKHGKVYIGKLPKEINISNTSLKWAGKKWAMVMLPLPTNYHQRLNLIVHELFHKIQPELGFTELYENQSNHLDEKTGRVYLKLELEALKEALKEEKKTLINNHLLNALTFRKYRHSYYSNAQKAEASLEINEGLAEYTGSILSGRNNQKLKGHYTNKINEFFLKPSFVRSFAYVTIPVYGFFMKMKNNKWNQAIESDTDLTDYIIGFFDFSLPENEKQNIEKIQNLYGYEVILAQEIKREKEKKEELKELQNRFLNMPVLTLNFENMNVSFDPGNLVPLNNIGTVYPNIRVTDNWGILTVKNGALLSKNWDKIIVSEPTDFYNTSLKGDGWELELNSGWEIVKANENYKLKKVNN